MQDSFLDSTTLQLRLETAESALEFRLLLRDLLRTLGGPGLTSGGGSPRLRRPAR